MTVIFFPIEIGLAHIVRSLAIAEELHHKGHRVIVALPKRKQVVVKNTPVELVDVSPTVNSDSFKSLTIFSDYSILNRQVKEEIEIIKKYKPDRVVVDYRLSALAAALINNIKTYCLMHGNSLPHGSYLPNPGLPKWLYRLLLPITQKGFDLGEKVFLRNLVKIVREYGFKIDLETWFQSMDYILPEAPFYLPAVNQKLKLHYVGAFEWNGFKNTSPDWLKDIQPDGKTLYLTFGGTGFAPKNLINLSFALIKKGYRVLVSTGTICNPEDFPKNKNLFVSRFLPGKKTCEKVDTIICHGGYGTMMEAVYSGKPFISIPFNPDQLTHAWRLQELGLGYCLLKLNLINLIGLFSFNWKVFENAGKKTSPEKVIEALNLVTKNRDQLQKSLSSFNKKHPYRNGAIEAANIIEA